MTGLCEGRVVVVTGAGRGIGAAHARAFARHGARVVVNDSGAAADGTGGDPAVADAVVEQIRAEGGEAVADHEDVADFDGAGRLIQAALSNYGRLDTLVNNAGGLRDRMFVTMPVDDWDVSIRMNLRSHFCPARHAASYWRDQAKAGADVQARIVNTSSGAGLMGSVGQSNYGAAKAAVAALTLIQAAELGRYGITANAVAPAARTRLTEAVFAEMMAAVPDGFDPMAPENIAPLVVWLGSAESAGVTGRVFDVAGGRVGVADGWRYGPSVDRGGRWDVAEVGAAVRDLLGKAPEPAPVYGA